MALLKTGVKYPIDIVSSFTYKCSNEECDYCITDLEEQNKVTCPICGCELRLISNNTETKSKED
jgi:rRNA maturation endonuclease Nob1